MNNWKKQNRILIYKIEYTLIILLLYFIGKNIPLHMVDIAYYDGIVIDTEALIMHAISGDVNQCSLFALGISPYMIASILVSVVAIIGRSDSKMRVSPSKKNRITMYLTLGIAVVQAIPLLQEIQFRESVEPIVLIKIVAGIEIVTGAVVVFCLASGNKRYGIGGQSALIFLNIVDGIGASLKGYSLHELTLPLLLVFMAVVVIAIFENSEKRIPVQRVSIHNIFADKNYLAIKMNPIGVMPAMFSMAFYLLPQLLVFFLNWIFPNNTSLQWWQENLDLSKPFGIVIYIFILYGLTVGFSRVFINPDEVTEQFLKNGDSIQNVHAGKDTKRYLSCVITGMSLFSATIMSACLGLPLLLQFYGMIEKGVATLPVSFMILTGVICNLIREIKAIKYLEAYKPFL